MDIFLEDIVKKEQKITDKLMVVGIYVLAVLLTFILIPASLLFGGNQIVSTIVLALIVGLWWGAIYLSKAFYVEYEYILTNNELDIDKIMAKTRRKRLTTIDFKDIELCAACDDVNYKNEFENNDGYKEIADYCGDNEGRTKYFVILSDDEGRKKYIINPKTKIMDETYKFNPRKIILKK